ncbi:MAG: hypothetical protein ACLFNN_02830 [Candidatus Paceibacterota bacterium]
MYALTTLPVISISKWNTGYIYPSLQKTRKDLSLWSFRFNLKTLNICYASAKL